MSRILSIDVLRGVDMFWISAGAHMIHALAPVTGWTSLVMLSHQFTHSAWDRFTFYDLIQPLFLFITVLTLPLSFQFAALRYTSVLGRIAVAGFAAALILMYFRRPRDQALWALGVLAGYWALLTFIATPGQPGPTYERGVNIVDYLNQPLMPFILISGIHDANGWFSTPPVVGQWLISSRCVLHKVGVLLAAGSVLAATGWGHWFPIIKHIWTSSYALYTAGLSCPLLAVVYGIVDGLGWPRWGFPFLLIGVNPLVIYLLLSTKLINFAYLADFFFGFAYLQAPGAWKLLWQGVAMLALQFGFVYVLYRKRLYWRV